MSVYFAQAGPYIKIGYSADPLTRVDSVTISVERPDDLPKGADVDLIGWVGGGRRRESAMHREFARDHVAGEWFYLDRDVVVDLIWADPHGIDFHGMSARAALAARKHPDLTRDQLAQAGVPIECSDGSAFFDEFFKRPA